MDSEEIKVPETSEQTISETITEEKKETRGRKKIADTLKFLPIDDYVIKNEVDETIKDIEPIEEGENKTAKNDEEYVDIIIDKKNLVLAEIFADSIVQKLLNVIGFNMELNPMSDNDLEILAKLAPPLKLKRSWENFFKFYLIAKAKN